MPPAGSPLEDVEILVRSGYLEARFLGSFEVDRFNRQFKTAAAACRERKVSLLLLDCTGLRGVLTTSDRYGIGEYAAAEEGELKVAVLGTRVLVDPRKFGSLVASNRGLRNDVFTDREAALAWLLPAE
jgi:hypothetical protein